MKQQDKVFMIVGSTAVLIAAGVTGTWLFGKSDATASSTTTTSAAADQSTPSQAAATSTTSTTDTSTTSAVSSSTTSSTSYKDGTYKTTANYYVPHGTNSLTASVTVSGGKVTAVSISNDYTDQESGMYIDSFMSSIQSAVVGKSVDGLSLSRIGGASLTTQAFDNALAKIRTDAKA